jgi:hypothetical protein
MTLPFCFNILLIVNKEEDNWELEICPDSLISKALWYFKRKGFKDQLEGFKDLWKKE